ncbi:MAG TPA: glycosyltransferase family 4 protein [Kiritimatiellia bacterium]|nr:glycosyltransferase family 4 protein [Kiritimatiellia bacterium]HRZ11755.1 glycosyltransferase family 4 protein [Kiritimatiellia bacterium]HSA17438.1 glycosyltransferase family 4 protein [Kiritimatiellia bacterium]
MANTAKAPGLACILRWFPAPSETFIFDEMTALQRAGAPLHLYTLYGCWRGPLSPDMPADDLPITRLGTRALGRMARAIGFWLKTNPPAARRLWRTVPWRRWRDLEMAGENLWAFLCGFYIARLVRNGGFSHLHAPWANGPASAAWVASQLTGIPFSFSTWAGDIFPPDGALSEKIRDAAFVRSTCRSFVPHLRQQAGLHADKIRVLYNGQDPARFQPAEARFQSPLKLLALGRFVRKKGFHVALHAAARLKAEGVSFRLTVGGDGPENSRLRRLARSLGLTGDVSFPGFVPRQRTSDLFRDCDVFLMPSVVDPAGDRDGIPNVVLEALLHRIPVVATNIGGIAEVIRDGVTGCLVPPNDPESLAAAVRRLAGGPDAARAMAERGRRFVLQEFHLDTNARRLFELIAQHSGPTP